jgi:hypothetical protein
MLPGLILVQITLAYHIQYQEVIVGQRKVHLAPLQLLGGHVDYQGKEILGIG